MAESKEFCDLVVKHKWLSNKRIIKLKDNTLQQDVNRIFSPGMVTLITSHVSFDGSVEGFVTTILERTDVMDAVMRAGNPLMVILGVGEPTHSYHAMSKVRFAVALDQAELSNKEQSDAHA